MRKYTSLLIICALIPIIILFSPIFKMNIHQPSYFEQKFEDARVIEILEENLYPDPVIAGRLLGTQKVKLELLTGKYKGRNFETNNPLSTSHNIHTKKGMVVIVGISENDGQPTAWVYNYKGETVLLILTGLFFLLLFIFGGIKGLKSIISLVFTGVVIIFIMMPLIYQGKDPAIIAVFVAIITSIVTFILISGFKSKTYAAIIGTVSGVTAAGFISWAAGNLTHLSGITMENSQQLLYIAQDYHIKIRGLMFTSILISSLGAVMDVAMSIASSTFEIHSTNPKLTNKELMKASMNVGKDIMGTMADTLILAFAGGSLTTMMMIWGFQMDFRQFINIPMIKTEIIQSLAGSIGIVLTVPITALISVAIYKKQDIEKSTKNRSRSQ